MKFPDHNLQPLAGITQREIQLAGGPGVQLAEIGDDGMGVAKQLTAPSVAANSVETDQGDETHTARGKGSPTSNRARSSLPTSCSKSSPCTNSPTGGGAATGLLPVWQDQKPPPFRAKFDGQPEKLAYFLTQVWNYLEQYNVAHPDKISRMGAVTSNLEGDSTEWLVSLYNEGALS